MSIVNAISGLGGSSGEIQANYLNLLITQLRHQDPLEPLNNNEMASQLAQLSQLDQLEQMNRTFQQVLLSEQKSQAASLIGREVAYWPAGATQPAWGRVDGADVSGGQVYLAVGGHLISLEDIQGIRG